MGSTTQRQIIAVISFFWVLFLSYQIILSLSGLKNTIQPEIYLHRIALCLTFLMFSVIGGWFAYRFFGGLVFSLCGAVMVLFVMALSSSGIYLWFLLTYALLCFMLYRVDQMFEDDISNIRVNREKYQREKNDLEVSCRAKGETISAMFEKYSTYYNLRKLAEELAASLSVAELAQKIVSRTAEFIFNGEMIFMTLAESHGRQLPIIAAYQMGTSKKSLTAKERKRFREGDLFDFWVLKNRRQVIINDVLQDFRFDVGGVEKLQHKLRSMIIAPLLYEGRTMGTLRINSSIPGNFTNDDLRLLDTIAVLASSALSNAMLYEQTEELAIRDSLTGLYLRRYFNARLRDEHQRALMTHRPFSFLMCDLDHFKACNDQYGHGAGDLMLIQFSKILSSSIENAIVARYGGEEFSVLLPEISKKEALILANRVREAVEQKPFIVRRERIHMTVSIGVASMPDDALDLEGLVEKADRALYIAKRQGRNQVCSNPD